MQDDCSVGSKGGSTDDSLVSLGGYGNGWR